MKLLSKIQLIALALEVFAQNPDQETCFAREDGNIFFTENYAELGRGKMKVYTFSKSELNDTKSEPKADASAAAPSLKDVKKVDAPATADATTGKEGKSPDTRTAKQTK